MWYVLLFAWCLYVLLTMGYHTLRIADLVARVAIIEEAVDAHEEILAAGEGELVWPEDLDEHWNA